MEIARPDLYNNDMIVVHDHQGFVSSLSLFSYEVQRMTSFFFPFHSDHRSGRHFYSLMFRFRNNRVSMLALAMKHLFDIYFEWNVQQMFDVMSDRDVQTLFDEMLKTFTPFQIVSSFPFDAGPETMGIIFLMKTTLGLTSTFFLAAEI
ncbi:fasciclin-like arabinogalactan protein 21, partial [Sesbania bispinosa]